LYDGTSGIPLAIVWCVANMAFGLSIKSALKGLKQRKSDVAEFLFRGTMNSIHGKDSYYALLSLVLFAGDATRNAWEYVFGGEDSTQRDLAIMELTKLCLIHITQNRYSLLPLVQDALVDEIQSQEEFRKQAIQRFVEYYCNYMKEHDTQRGSLKKDAQTATREVKNLIAASRYAYDHGMMEQAIELVDGLTSILWPLGLWNEWLEVLDLGVYACRSSNNPQKEAWFRKDKGWIYVERGEMSSAQREAEAALALIDKSEPSETHIACLRILASVERANGNTDAARKYFDQAIDLLERTNNPRKLASTLANVAAMLLESEGASEQAMSVLVRSQNILEPLGDSWRLARIQYLIGEWYWIKNDVNAAKRFYELARKANEAIGIKRNDILIDICLGEAKLFLANGEYEAALARLRAVEPLLDAHGLSRKNKYQQLLDKIEKAWRVQ
jgi:tetratricopeptide (TPR) repeat protein